MDRGELHSNSLPGLDFILGAHVPTASSTSSPSPFYTSVHLSKMVRSYLRHGATKVFGVIASPTCTSCVYSDGLAYTAGWEDVLVWDVKKGNLASMWHSSGVTSPVTCISRRASDGLFAVGHQDGSLRLWTFEPPLVDFVASDPDSESGANERTTFQGHSRAVSAACWSDDDGRLFSGGMDGNVVVWDTVEEVGLYRLKGHKGPITSITSIGSGYLLTTSKDTFLKLWDLSTQHCVQTVVVGRGEVVSCAVQEDDEAWNILTGSSDGEAKCWRINKAALERGLREGDETLVESLGPLPVVSTTHAISHISFQQDRIFLQTADKALQVLRLRTREELEAKQARRRKREREKGREVPVEQLPESRGWIDLVTDFAMVRAGGKIRAVAYDGQDLLVSLANNQLDTYHLGTAEPSRTHTLELPGHRTDVRSLSVSSDDQVVASASSGSLKLWNLRTMACIRTMDCGYALCSAFLPGDRHVLVGTKAGELELFDLASSTLLASYKAHDGPVWSIDIRPGGVVSGSADKDVKFWDLREREVGATTIMTRLGEERTIKTKQLSLAHVKTLKMTDDVLAVKYSPDGRLLAVSLLDSTVKIFFADTLKFFLSLYGHKLPVLAMDISSDSKLIATCSADKNVKLWGLDFGDCHRSIFAHEESIMQVAFERGTHNFWTVGKDRLVKYWDGDRFEQIQKLEGHHGEVWALAVSHYGEFVVTGSHDKSIRVWEKTEEPLFLEEEREREMEQHMADQVQQQQQQQQQSEESGGDGEVEPAHLATAATLMSGEKIMEAIELADADRQLTRDYEESKAKASGSDLADALMPPTRSVLLMGASPEDHVRSVLEKVPAAQMEDALLVLPFKQVISLLEYLDLWAADVHNTPIVTRVLFFMLRTHHHQIVSNRVMRTTLLSIRLRLRAALDAQKSSLGFNKAALRYIKRQHDATKTASLLEEEALDEDQVRAKIEAGRKQKKRVAV